MSNEILLERLLMELKADTNFVKLGTVQKFLNSSLEKVFAEDDNRMIKGGLLKWEKLQL